jgi:hypothetical protein
MKVKGAEPELTFTGSSTIQAHFRPSGRLDIPGTAPVLPEKQSSHTEFLGFQYVSSNAGTGCHILIHFT